MLIQFSKFFPHCFFEGDDGSGTGGGYGPKISEPSEPAIEYIDKKDPVSGRMVKVPKDIDILYGHVISHTRNEIEKKYKPVVEALDEEKASLEEARSELEKIRQQSMTAEEKAQANAKKVIDDVNKKYNTIKEEADKWQGLYFDTITEKNIFDSFNTAENTILCNPRQTAVLLKQIGNARVEEIIDASGKPTNAYETRLTLELTNEKGEREIVEGRPSELFKRWINMPENSHHIQNNLAPGGGSRPGQKGTTGNSKELMNLSPVERINTYRQSK